MLHAGIQRAANSLLHRWVSFDLSSQVSQAATIFLFPDFIKPENRSGFWGRSIWGRFSSSKDNTSTKSSPVLASGTVPTQEGAPNRSALVPPAQAGYIDVEPLESERADEMSAVKVPQAAEQPLNELPSDTNLAAHQDAGEPIQGEKVSAALQKVLPRKCVSP